MVNPSETERRECIMFENNQKGLVDKINLFMKHHIEPSFDVESIRWWFSLSGGKDSFAMALALKFWYQEHGKRLDAKGFHISQWSSGIFENINKQLPWLNIIHIDGKNLTKNRIRYKFGDQAPCRECSDIRRELNDHLIRSHQKKPTKTNLLARGLHLTDTAVSLLWRRVLGYQPVHHLISKEKARPLIRLWEGTYLAKPLFYAREFETQCFARHYGFKPSCCGCPGCKFPARRDIVEETIVPIFNDPLWEFSIPDLSIFFDSIKNGPLLHDVYYASVYGKEEKKLRLPKDFPGFAVNFYRQKIQEKDYNWLSSKIDYNISLDQIGFSLLHGNSISYEEDKVPAPNLIKNDIQINPNLACLISSLGPFWGALGLNNKIKDKALFLHETIFGLRIDDLFSQTNELLKMYYKKVENEKINRENSFISSIPSTNNCLCTS